MLTRWNLSLRGLFDSAQLPYQSSGSALEFRGSLLGFRRAQNRTNVLQRSALAQRHERKGVERKEENDALKQTFHHKNAEF